MAKKNCKHEHECESCIREEVAVLEAKLRTLKAKLPSSTITICNHGCHGYCNHWKLGGAYITPAVGYAYSTNAIGSASGTFDYTARNTTSGTNLTTL